MNISKIGTNIYNASTSLCVNSLRGGSIVYRRPNLFHGINPTLTYLPTGKTFALPRFCSEEMKTARQMNRVAIRQLKTPIDTIFSKASKQDFLRLTDTSFEVSNLRTVYTNPKNGKVYHLLSEGKTTDGLNVIRVLDNDGAYLKTIEVKPKKIIILDNFIQGKRICNSQQYEGLAHGDYVSLIAKRNNPFADYEYINIQTGNAQNSYETLYKNLEAIQKRIDAGEQIDFISLSIGRKAKISTLEDCCKQINSNLKEAKTTNILNSNDVFNPFPLGVFAAKNKGKVRIIESSGNFGKDYINIDLSYPDVEGVGALTETGKMATLSASRNSLFTQHYELGVYKFTPTEHGLSLFGGKTTEIPLKKEYRDIVKKYLGKEPQLATQDEIVKINKLNKEAKKEYEDMEAAVRRRIVTPQEERELSELYNKAKAEHKNQTGTTFQKQYSEKLNEIQLRIYNQMKNHKRPLAEAYKKEIDKLIQDGKVMKNMFGEYYVPEKNPLSTLYYLQFNKNLEGKLTLASSMYDFNGLTGTSYSTPARSAKLALEEMLHDLL